MYKVIAKDTIENGIFLYYSVVKRGFNPYCSLLLFTETN